MKIFKNAYLNTASSIRNDFLVGANIVVRVHLAEDELSSEIAAGYAVHAIEKNDTIQAWTAEEFFQTELGQRLLELAMAKLIDEVAEKAARLAEIKDLVASGGEL